MARITAVCIQTAVGAVSTRTHASGAQVTELAETLASLARVELHAVFTALPHRFPNLELAVPVEQLQLRGDHLTGGLTALSVMW